VFHLGDIQEEDEDHKPSIDCPVNLLNNDDDLAVPPFAQLGLFFRPPRDRQRNAAARRSGRDARARRSSASRRSASASISLFFFCSATSCCCKASALSVLQATGEIGYWTSEKQSRFIRSRGTLVERRIQAAKFEAQPTIGLYTWHVQAARFQPEVQGTS
jgi:hypothetical protein